MNFRSVLVHGCFDQRLGELRPKTCRCRYLITWEEANEYVAEGKADWIIVGWKKGFPIEGRNLVWGARPEETQGNEKISSAYAKKTPRVHTIEKADMERAYVNQYREDQERIETYGQLSIEVVQEMIAPWREDPFAGRALLYMPNLGQLTEC